jgi:hypothetical protein
MMKRWLLDRAYSSTVSPSRNDQDSHHKTPFLIPLSMKASLVLIFAAFVAAVPTGLWHTVHRREPVPQSPAEYPIDCGPPGIPHLSWSERDPRCGRVETPGGRVETPGDHLTGPTERGPGDVDTYQNQSDDLSIGEEQFSGDQEESQDVGEYGGEDGGEEGVEEKKLHPHKAAA